MLLMLLCFSYPQCVLPDSSPLDLHVNGHPVHLLAFAVLLVDPDQDEGVVVLKAHGLLGSHLESGQLGFER